MRTGVVVGNLLLVVSLLFGTTAAVAGQDYESLEGLEKYDVAYDVRTASPKSAALFLKLIHESFNDENIRAVTDAPNLVVVFSGPAVKLISTEKEGFSAEEQELLDAIAKRISAMSEDGVELEACLVAAEVLGVDAKTLLPGIEPVPNGWISLTGYQAQGYSMIPVF